MTEAPLRVLVVDDSAFARKVIRETLASHPRIEVIGTAADGLDALEQIAQLRPEVVTLDLMMPALDGLSLVRSLPREDAPFIVIVSMSDADSEVAIEALHAGAFDLVQKPTALATPRLYDLGDDLVRKVLAAGDARRRGDRRAPASVRRAVSVEPARLVVIGTSTGGPQALTRLLGKLPADLPVPMAISLHIPRGYTRTMAERLDRTCAIAVQEASDRTELRPGLAVLAQGGSQLTIVRSGQGLAAVTEPRQSDQPFAPSVNLLFDSAARAAGPAVVGVVLTGMGDDGLEGARAIRQTGGVILTESEATCVVYGMPRVVAEAGLSSGEAPLGEMAAAILTAIGKR